MIELNALPFWLICAVAVLVVAPVESPRLRRMLLAASNVAFLIMLLRWQAIALLLALLIVFVLVQIIGRTRHHLLVALATGTGLVALFLVHKLPPLAQHLGLDRTTRILALIGYSYVALRMVELLRAVVERRHPAPDVIDTVNYLLPFHMLAAGPIQAYDDFVAQSSKPSDPRGRDVFGGVERVASGLFKKFVLAYLIQSIFLTNFEAGGWYFVLEVQVFFIWLFLDFSAYSDIAVGVGRLIGVPAPENFNRPLLARNVIDFWDRWHMSLSLFIRRNIFIPIQMFLMRQNEQRDPLVSASAAIAISFVLCGLWHGLTVGFLIWGALQAAGLIAVRVYGQLLQTRLGRARHKRYVANRWVRVAAVFLTFEFEAVALVALFRA